MERNFQAHVRNLQKSSESDVFLTATYTAHASKRGKRELLMASVPSFIILIYLCMFSFMMFSLSLSLTSTFTMMTFKSQCVVGFSLWMILSCGHVPACAVPVKAGCEVLGEELEDFHAQGEAMAFTFPILEATIWYRNLPEDNSTTFQLFHSKHHDLSKLGHRVVQQGRTLWLLPSLPTDSGTYTYVFSSDAFCLTGSLTVTIYEKGNEDMEMMSHPVSSKPDKNLTIECPHINHFNRLESPRWVKGFPAGVPIRNGTRYEISSKDKVSLTIRNVSAEHEGLYTCWLTVVFNNVQYNVSRTWKLRVLYPVTNIPETQTEATIKSGDVTLTSPLLQPPHITSPVNGSVIESRLGSSLLIRCKAFVGHRSSDITKLTWLVDDRMVDSFHLRGRAYQETRVSSDHVEALLVFLEVHEEDTRTRLKCVAQNGSGKQEVVIQIKLEDSMLTWLAVALVASCFLVSVVVVFLHLLCRQQRKHDYILARQNSAF